jgi:D-glycero-alpha-D-manno-heptose-7-phosphate kinase
LKFERFNQVGSVSAPTRIADLGGWTDTWFAGHGAVCFLAVWPGVEVRIAATEGPAGVEVRLRNFDRAWHWSAGTPPQVCPDPLIAACLDEADVPDGAWALDVGSSVPPGASMGTSASVCVAVLAALDRLRGSAIQPARTGARELPLASDPSLLARRAHLVETRRLSQQSGIQDQWAAAAGGASLIEMAAYPSGRRTPLMLSPETTAALDARMLVLFLGRGHNSSDVHRQVVEALQDAGSGDARLDALRQCAHEGAAALVAGDLAAYGAVLTRNTTLQAQLHASLVSAEARAVIDAVRGPDAIGWKVNGAGGSGGSIAVFAESAEARARLLATLRQQCPWATPLDVRLASGGVAEI